MWRIEYRCWHWRIKRCYGSSLRLRKIIKPLVVISGGGSWVGVRKRGAPASAELYRESEYELLELHVL